MQYNLLHRGAVIKSFDTSEMEPDEIWALKQLGDGRYFTLERANPDLLPGLPDGQTNLDGIDGWVYKPDQQEYRLPARRY
jgi:hypothetical protein